MALARAIRDLIDRGIEVTTLGALAKGDEVVTAGGMAGRVDEIGEMARALASGRLPQDADASTRGLFEALAHPDA